MSFEGCPERCDCDPKYREFCPVGREVEAELERLEETLKVLHDQASLVS